MNDSHKIMDDIRKAAWIAEYQMETYQMILKAFGQFPGPIGMATAYSIIKLRELSLPGELAREPWRVGLKPGERVVPKAEKKD